MSLTPKPKPVTRPRSAEYLRRQLDKKQQEIEGLRLQLRMLRQRPTREQFQRVQGELAAEQEKSRNQENLINALTELQYSPHQSPALLQRIRYCRRILKP